MESAPEGEVSPRADLVSALRVDGVRRRRRHRRLAHGPAGEPAHQQVRGARPGAGPAGRRRRSLLGIALALRAIRRGALRPAGPRRGRRAGRATYMGLVLARHARCIRWCWWATACRSGWRPALFVAGFIFFFDRERQSALGRSTARQALLALVYGAVDQRGGHAGVPGNLLRAAALGLYDVPRSLRLRALAGRLPDAGLDRAGAGLHAGGRGHRRAAGPHRHHGRGA